MIYNSSFGELRVTESFGIQAHYKEISNERQFWRNRSHRGRRIGIGA